MATLLASGCGAKNAATITASGSASRAASAATPTEAPPPPLAVIQNGPSIQAVDAGGHVQWALSQTDVRNLLAGSSDDSINAQVAGPNVMLSGVPPSQAALGTLVVLSRTGQLVGRGSFEQNTQYRGAVVGSPTGTQWAWSVDDGTGPTADERHGRIVIAGLGVPEHNVYSWVSPPMATTEIVAAWTDMGIVMERVSAGGCGIGFHSDAASFLIDPVTGTLTPLFVDGEHYGDAQHNVRVSFARQSPSAVLVNGSSFDEPGTVATATYVGPDGAKVGVQRYSAGGCGGASVPSLNTEVIDVSSGTHRDVAGCGINGWLDTTHFACSAFNDPSQKLETIDGSAGAPLGNGTFVGVV